MRIRVPGTLLLLALLAAPAAAPAQAVATIDDFVGPFSFGPFPAAPLTVGTFSFSLPAGQSIFSAILRGSLGGPGGNVGTAPLQLFLDGLMVAECTVEAPCFRNRTPFSFAFAPDQFSVLDDGMATLTAVQTGPFVMKVSNATLSVNAPNAVVPEPASMLLLGTGLAGVIGVARRRRRSGDLSRS